MASKARRGDHAPGSEPRAAVAADGGALDAALDRLHRAPLEQFVQVRGEIVKELRAAGDAATARAVGAAKKPARTAWALNQLARHRPELLRDVFEAHDAALKSQRSGDPEEVRATARAYREKIAAVVRAAHEILGDAGGELNAAQSRRIGETMQAGATGGEAVREQLLSGRLVEDLDVDDPFGGMEVGERAPGKHHAKEGTHAADKGREKEHGGGREQGGGKEHAAAREHAAAQARAAAERERAEKARVERQRAVEQARRKVQDLEEKARQAAAEVKEAQAVAIEARTAARRAEADAERAERALGDVERRLGLARAELAELRK